MRALLRWVQPLLAVAAAVSIIAYLASQWPDLRSHQWHLSARWLAAAAVLLLASWAVEIQLWRALMRSLGGHIAYVPAARIWFLSAVVRYVPGNIWQPLSMTLYGQRLGIRPEVTVTSVALYQLVILLAAGPLAALYFWLTGNWGLLTQTVGRASTPLLLLALFPALLFILWPGLLLRLLNWMLARVGRPALEQGLGRLSLLGMLLIAAFDWLLWGLTFATLTWAINDYTQAEMINLAPHLVASYAIAYSIGFLSLITPSGFGVREGALYLLLATVMPGTVVTVAALAMRVWTMLGEVIMALLAAAVGDGRSTEVAPESIVP